MARIAMLRRALGICFEAGITPFLWGHKGVGKSSLFKQQAAAQGWGFIDLRCSQLEAADLRGLPDRTADGRTRFLPPTDLPTGDLEDDEYARLLGPEPDPEAGPAARADYQRRLRGLQPRRARGILLLDELNRAPDDVLQAAFQLVLDHAVGEYALPPGWHVAAAGNFATGYQVNSCEDPAFLDRFCHLVFPTGATTASEWSAWMTTQHGAAAEAVLSFAASDLKNLDGETKNALSFTITPSRRSWEAVVRACQASRSGPEDRATFEVIAGLVGPELATAFRRFQPGPISPADVLETGVVPLSDRLAQLDRFHLVALMCGLTRVAGGRLDEPPVVEAALDFAAWLAGRGGDRDLALAFCRDLASQEHPGDGAAQVRAALVTNPRLTRAVARRRPLSGGFLARLANRPELQNLLSELAWGDDASA